MYVDGKFAIEPKTNFFDRILFGKIVAEYRKYNMRKRFKPIKRIKFQKYQIKKKKKLTIRY